MNPLKRAVGTRRNDRCVCGSGKKFKYCCSPAAAQQPDGPKKKTHYIDTGEVPVRYVICDSVGTSFFSTKNNEILVFSTRADALSVATLEEFQTQEPGEINVAGVGKTKWQHLQSTLPFVEVESVEQAVAFVRDRIEHMSAQLAAAENEHTQDDAGNTQQPPAADA